MSKFIVHNASGDIIRVIDVPDEVAHLQLLDGEQLMPAVDPKPHWKVDVVKGAVIEMPEPPEPVNDPIPVLPEYAQLRLSLYPSIGEQLDMLWRAMDQGEIPKATEFYERIKAVKDAVPVDASVKPTIINVVKAIRGVGE